MSEEEPLPERSHTVHGVAHTHTHTLTPGCASSSFRLDPRFPAAESQMSEFIK